MKKKNKEINIFSVSFLDLLSGALAAVIILFIIVPKMDADSRDAIDALAELDLQAGELFALVEQLENSVDRRMYEELQSRIQNVQNALEEARNSVQELLNENEILREQIETISNELTQTRDELSQTRDELGQTQQDLRNANAEINNLIQRIAELENEVSEQSEIGPGHTALLGVSADFAILAFWVEEVDIDIHFTDLSSNEVCNFRNSETSFGRLLQDVQSSPGEEGYELIFQQDLVPGEYKIEVHWFDYNSTNSNYNSINVELEIIFMPFRPNEQKLRKSATLSDGNLRFISNVNITQNGIS